MDTKLEKVPHQLQNEIGKYFILQLGGKKVPCPYYINTKVVAGNLRVMSGKGTAEEIELETKIWAKVKGFDLETATVEDVRRFMTNMHIGVDCSGFVVNVLDIFMRKIH